MSNGFISLQQAIDMTTRYRQNMGSVIDPVYSGKGMAGLIDLIRAGHFKATENVVFLHTGGSVGLFGYNDLFDATRPS